MVEGSPVVALTVVFGCVVTSVDIDVGLSVTLVELETCVLVIVLAGSIAMDSDEVGDFIDDRGVLFVLAMVELELGELRILVAATLVMVEEVCLAAVIVGEGEGEITLAVDDPLSKTFIG